MTLGLFNKKTTISMEFCSDRVKVVVGRYQKKNITIDKCFSIPIPEDLYEDGIIKDTNKYLYELERGLSENKVSRGDVYGVINSSNIIIREISIPKVGANQIGAILNYQLDEYLPVDPQAYVVQYLPLDTVEENGVEKQNLMLIGVPKSIIEPHFNLLQNLGLKPLVLDYAGNAITKLIRFNDSINGVSSFLIIFCISVIWLSSSAISVSKLLIFSVWGTRRKRFAK
jgi:type IV pilus assembly protein PilM